MGWSIKRFGVLCSVFLAGAAGGLLFHTIGAPLPWLIGPLLAVACLSFAGLRFDLASGFREVSQLVVGCAVGLQFTRDVFSDVVTLVPIMILAAAALILAGAVMARLLARYGRVDRSTAFFASMPGGVVEMAFMAERYGGDANIITVGQTIRVILTVLIIPLVLQLTHPELPLTSTQNGTETAVPFVAAALLVVGYILARRFVRIGVPNAWVMAGVLTGIVFNLAFDPTGKIPPLWVNVAQVTIGVTLGLKVQSDTLRKAGSALPFLVLNTIGLLAVSGAIAAAYTLFTAPDFDSLLLANAPAGVAEMSITAKVLELNVPLVVAFQLVRILMVMSLSAWVFRLFWPDELDRNK